LKVMSNLSLQDLIARRRGSGAWSEPHTVYLQAIIPTPVQEDPHPHTTAAVMREAAEAYLSIAPAIEQLTGRGWELQPPSLDDSADPGYWNMRVTLRKRLFSLDDAAEEALACGVDCDKANWWVGVEGRDGVAWRNDLAG
jgi:hypothetical protein